MSVKTQKKPLFNNFTVEKVDELNFFDLTGENAGTKGTSSKMYTIEVQVEKNGDRVQIYSSYGPTGRVQKEDWRYPFPSKAAAEKEYNRIVASKQKKGYKLIDVAQRAFGSSEAKAKTKPVQFKNAEETPLVKISEKLHPETSRIVSTLMGSTNTWVIQTLKCPLGQLTNNQIDLGRKCLDEAKELVSNKSNKKRIQELTNEFYALIPHNLGSGYRGKMTELLLDSKEKIDQKEYDLDTLLDAKAIGATLTSDSTYDQYKSLNTDFEYIDKSDTLFKWLNDLVQKTRASNHRFLGKIVLLNAWKIARNKERDIFLKRAKEISKECGKQVIPDQMTDLVKKRSDVYDEDLFKKANIIPLFHGTRTQNITGILNKGLLIRPSGVVITGAMYGASCIYFSSNSSKSVNYCSVKSSYWANGNDRNAFLFISDCALGKQIMARGPYQYTNSNIKPNHSVWAKGGQSGVINDEMMLYGTTQHNLRYFLEFTCE